MNLIEKRLSRNQAFDGRVLNIVRDEVELPDGSRTARELIIHPGGAGILPIDDDGNVTLVRQYRPGADGVLTEICAGRIEKGETPAEGAARELSEELGLRARELIPLGFFYVSAAYNTAKTYIFLARGLSETERSLDDDEFLEAVKIPFESALEDVMNGKITDCKTQIAILKAYRLLYGKN